MGHARAVSPDPASRPAPTPQPSRTRRLITTLRFPVGMVLNVLHYARHASDLRRREVAGDASDLPPPLPEQWVDEDVKVLEHGHGPLFHREFEVLLADADLSARGLIECLAGDLDRAVPSEVATFRKTRGELGGMAPGDEYRVRIPAPWDGPVRVMSRDATSFRFATLRGHLEAGQIEFRARDEPDGPGTLGFVIESWSRAGNAPARLAFARLRIGKELQLNMWAQFCLAVPRIAGARRTRPVQITTRRVDHPVS